MSALKTNLKAKAKMGVATELKALLLREQGLLGAPEPVPTATPAAAPTPPASTDWE